MNLFRKSVPRPVKVCGYEIKKKPLGAYLDMLDKLRTAPAELLNACFPGCTLDQVLTRLRHVDEKLLVEIVSNALSKAAPMAVELLASLSDVPAEALLDSPEIGLSGAVDIIRAVWEVNDLGNVLAALRELRAPQTQTMTPGSKA